jgi:hypothetical protein
MNSMVARAAAVLGLCALLLAFQYVVAQAESAGAARRAARVAADDARWQCEALPSARERSACRAGLEAPRVGETVSSR